MNWHQQRAARFHWQHRNEPAHIWADDYIQTGRALCGDTRFLIHVDREHAHNPANKTCKKCLTALAELDK